MNNTLSRWVIAACLAALAGATAATAAEVTGTATFAGEGEAGKQAAIKLALRDACEKSCGVFLDGQRHVRNHEQVFDRVMTQSAGFVTRYDVKRADFFEGAWDVAVTADVACAKFAETWKLTYCEVNSPRLMVVITQQRDGQAESLRTVQAAIERYLLKKGFRLVDKSQFDEVKESRLKEAALADDLATAASVARDFGSELLVVGSVSANKAGTESVAGMAFEYYVAQAVVKVVQTDSAALVVSEEARARAGSRAAATAAQKAVDQLAEQITNKVWEGCLANWDKMVAGNYRCELHISGVTGKDVLDVEKQLKALQGVHEVNLRSMRAEAAHFEIVSAYAAKELFRLIVESKVLTGLEITGITQNVIQARWKKQSI